MPIRPADESDLPALAGIAVAGMTFLIERYEPGRAETLPLDPDDRLPLLRHVLATGTMFVADEGEPVGFSGAVVRDDVWHLAQLWVFPENHGRGIGGALIDAALEWGAGARAFTVVSSPHPAAETLYLRRSMFPVWTQLDVRGPPSEEPPMPDGVSELSEEDQIWVDRLDRDARGVARPEDHALFRTHGKGLALRRDGEPVGYVYVWPDGRVGPSVAADAADVPALVRAGCHLGGRRAWCLVPSTNWAALKELASLGSAPSALRCSWPAVPGRMEAGTCRAGAPWAEPRLKSPRGGEPSPSPPDPPIMRAGDLALDLGTANTLVFVQGRGIVFNEPTVVAMNARDGEVLSMGGQAWEMIGRTPANIVAVRPLRRGAITDYEITQQMIRVILKRVGVSRLFKPRVLVCVPSAITEVERRAVEEATLSAGARSVALIEEPLAAAIGAGLPITEPLGNFVVDVGGGTTEVAMVSMGGIVTSKAIRVGGFDMDASIQNFIRRHYNLAIGERVSEKIKIAGGTAYPVPDAPAVEVRGRELATGLPRSAEISQEEMREALAEPVNAVVGATRDCLAQSPPELGHDVLERGMFLTGGGGLLKGLDMRLSQECEVPVHLTDQPLETVVLGAGRCLELLQEAPPGLFATSPRKRR